ncbi:FAD-dependent oxidoreductase [Glutamicibacter sp. PS]|uniref:FAD-dependent oxidoreductase n=1 Tax=Glutamicibacter sp. PS TaxID=3075634 RepID=UPI0028447233|nr:FAD-dependent oxidoreductase [Glutamicibacter sp. PS]MDR4532669.1 FAD-dependent oxidoreductase [Glutamicibacter sp. PS]
MTAQNPSASGEQVSRATCAIVGGGPAGMVLGLLLARAGVTVTVLEKHADFLRDFRGDTVHPTTLSLLDDLGLIDQFDQLPHSKITTVRLPGSGPNGPIAVNFGHLPLRHPYVAMVPQWDLLNLIAEAARAEPTFTLLTEHEVTDVVREGERIVGVSYQSPQGVGRLIADLTVACDGRWSAVRRAPELPVKDFLVGFDVWWCRLDTQKPIGESLIPRFNSGRVAIGIPRTGYLQVAQLGFKGTDAQVSADGIVAYRANLGRIFPELSTDTESIGSMDEVKHLDVRLDRLRRWYAPGVLCIGDAAHAMSPVGGVGINLAVQDAVATARLLATALKQGRFAQEPALGLLARVQRRRSYPTRVIQALQRFMHRNLIMPALRGRAPRPPRALSSLLRRVPILAAVPAAILGVGPRPERAPAWARR